MRTFLRGLSERRAGARLAAAVRDHARTEQWQSRRAGVVDHAALRERAELYRWLARALETGPAPDPETVGRVRALLARPVAPADFGGAAKHRDEVLAGVADALAAVQEAAPDRPDRPDLRPSLGSAA
jgi:hypothetical protein